MGTTGFAGPDLSFMFCLLLLFFPLLILRKAKFQVYYFLTVRAFLTVWKEGLLLALLALLTGWVGIDQISSLG
jgi:hypothetical protein